MKLFKNRSKKGNEYYSTSFYKKDLGGNILKKPIYVRFQRGTEPLDAEEYDLEMKAYVNGVEYDVLLDAYDKDGQTEGTLFFGQFNKPRQDTEIEKSIKKTVDGYHAENMAEYLNAGKEDKGTELKIDADELPFID